MKNWALITMVCSLLAPGAAFAQDAAPAESTGEAPAPTPGSAIPTEMELEGHATEEPMTTPPGEAEGEEDHKWYDDLNVNVFADTFYMVDWNHPERADATQNVAHRAYDFTSGFALAFAGLDISYAREHFGATLGLRWGKGAERYLIGTNTPGFIGLKQAFVSYMPTSNLQIDAGQFDTPYGAEVAESWLNLNYTRTPLNYLMQPFYHTGLRATWQVNDTLMVRGLLVNGINNGIASRLSPSLGAQVGLTPTDGVAIYAGYFTGAPNDYANQADPTDARINKPFQHFLDLVASFQFGDFRLVANGDMWILNPAGSTDRLLAGGVSLVAGYQVTPKFGVAVRADYLNNADAYFNTGTALPGVGGAGTIGYPGANSGYTPAWKHLGVGTLTFDYRPFGNHAIFRLEQRFEYADESVFPNGTFGVGDPTDMTTTQGWVNDTSKFWTATTLSLVVQMND